MSQSAVARTIRVGEDERIISSTNTALQGGRDAKPTAR
jgi:hypothetical protein